MRTTLEWGLRGARNAMVRRDAVVLIDVLSFSTTAVTAVDLGAVIYPHPLKSGAEEYAAGIGAAVLLGRREALETG